jgi:hypothetical protein
MTCCDLTWTRRIFLQAFLNGRVGMNDGVIALCAAIVSNCVSRSIALVARLMTIEAYPVLGVFRAGAVGNAILAVLYVHARVAVVGIWSCAGSLALGMTIAAGFLINLINTRGR